jgi:Phosphoglycerol transferase and related proteins, alkaline phosphatase superfamily
MNQSKSLTNIFRKYYPLLVLFCWLISFACIFNTFDLALEKAGFNLLLSLPILGFSMMIFRNYQLSVAVSSFFAFLIYYIDQLIFSVRLTHIRYSDFGLFSQAARVANRYKPIWSSEMTRRFAIAAALCMFLFFVARYYRIKNKRSTVLFTGLGLLAVGAFVIFTGILPHEPEDFDFTSQAENNGLFYSCYCQYHESGMTAPDGYSKERAEEILSNYTETAGESDVNIIVIMNESLADYSLLGEIPFNDPLPNLHGNNKNCFYGKLAVSVFGGGTCNTEYEFLTGNAMAFLPEGSMPYLQYVVNDENSIAWDMGELGYSKTAIHPYYSEEWNRTQVYQFLGFDQFISGVDFGNAVVTNGMRATARPSQNLISFGEGPLYVRGLISDQSCFERVLEEEQNQSFVFAVTMQNHGGYEYEGEDFVNIEYVTEEDCASTENMRPTRRTRLLGMSGEDRENETYKVNQYLTCASLSDAAFKALTDKLEDSNQKTIVLMFGDHQPSLRILEDYMDIDGFSEDMYYEVPYVLWANFDIEFDAPEYTSPNYLSAILKKNAGLPLTAWDLFRLDMMKEYPVIALDHILDKDYRLVDAETLIDYAIVQYMRMFGK